MAKNTLSLDLKKRERQIRKLPTEAFRVWIKNTPIRTGNARSQTSLVGNQTIFANYEYAVPLDDGHSKQSPQGMVKPTTAFLRRRLAQIMRKR